MIRRIRLQFLAPQDRKAWQKQYYEHQKYWQRRRLLALKAIWDGQNLSEVCSEQKVRWQTLVYWLDSYLHGGFDKLLKKLPVHRKQLLSEHGHDASRQTGCGPRTVRDLRRRRNLVMASAARHQRL